MNTDKSDRHWSSCGANGAEVKQLKTESECSGERLPRAASRVSEASQFSAAHGLGAIGEELTTDFADGHR